VALAVWFGAAAYSSGPAEQAPPQPSAAPAPKRPVPVAANTLTRTPESYYGEVVSVSAPVGRMLSPTAFVVDDILVLAPTLTEPLAPEARVTVVGEALRFEPSEIASRAKGYTPDLPPAALAAHRGRPAILATAVVNAALVDLAIRRPPPMTPEEAAFDNVMKRIGPAFSSLGKAVAGPDASTVLADAKTLASAFAEAEAFWKARGTADALEWTRAARKHVAALERSASSNRWDEARASAGDLGKMCQACHSAYRERFEDGSYAVRRDR
jgi:cytochrome c556